MKLSKLFMAIGAAVLSFNAHAAISVGPSGAGPLTFDTSPTVADGWSTLSVAGGNGAPANTAALDAAAMGLDATAITAELTTSGTLPPSQSPAARHNTNGFYLQTRPTANSYLVLMATLQNDTGGDVTNVTISYDWDQKNLNPVDETSPGHRAFYSLTGAPESWTLISQFSTNTTSSTAQNLLASIDDLGTWIAGNPLYIIWADDNGPGGTANPMEGGYTIDNFTVTLVSGFVSITTPGVGQRFAVGTPITINADALLPGTITGISFYQDGTLVGNDPLAPYSVDYNDATLGTHDLTAIATDNMGNSRTSSVVQIVVVTNAPPTVTINTPDANDLIIASNVVLFATAADTDATTVAQVQFLDGNTPAGAADTTAPYTINYKPVTPGTHTFRAVATDNFGLSATSPPVTITVVAPLNSLIPFGATWKYLDDGSNLGNQWFEADDALWDSGAGELGYGDNDEATAVSFGGDTNDRYITTYFKHHFTVADPDSITTAAIRLRYDDGAIVYLNGNFLFSANMINDPNQIDFRTLALNTIDDDLVVGAFLAAGEIALNPGDNVLAVEIHQATTNSSDISFDLELIANPSDNPPVISLLTPIQGQEFVSDNTVNATAVAMDKDGGVVSVEFYLDGTSVGAVLGPPYASTVTPTAGMHVLSAVATDNTGLMSTSSVIITNMVTTLVNTNAVWSYLDNGTDQDIAWRQLEFDVTGWGSGPAELGYGDVAPEPIEATVIGFGPDANNKFITYYFRHLFDATDVANATNLIVRLNRDDGGVVYINGTEVFRDNMPAGPIDFMTPAASNTPDEATFFSTNVSPSVLVEGQNIVAVEIHQVLPTSSDISFNLQLQTVAPLGPPSPRLTITLVSPTSATISWTPDTLGFSLEQSGSVLGPWTTSPSQVNGQTVTPIPGVRFYRLQNPNP